VQTSFTIGDERALEALFKALYPGLVTFASRLVASEAAAEDIVQSVFLELCRAREGTRLIGTPRSYLYAATRNRALDYLKHQWVERQHAAELLAGAPDSDRAPDAQLMIEAQESATSLAAAIARLPERARLVASLRWIEGLSHAEIAEALGISVKGVEVQITRILKALRRHIGTDAGSGVG
jgi:RNA polymerase sigma-70 factor, ECF subfamily